MALSFIAEAEFPPSKKYLEVQIASSEPLRPPPLIKTQEVYPPSISTDSNSGSFVPLTMNQSLSTVRKRPTLPPETLLCHAFGPSALDKWTAASSKSPVSCSFSTPSSSSVSSSSSSSPESVVPPPEPKKTSLSYNHGQLPKTPPPGTFRSAPKVSKRIVLHPEDDINNIVDLVACITEDSDPQEREPPMSASLWRKKAEERAERKRQRRSIRRDKTLTRLPLEYDGSEEPNHFHLPPLTDIPRSPTVRKSSLPKSLTLTDMTSLTHRIDLHRIGAIHLFSVSALHQQ
ncbi:hypothetical protein PNOK_0901000 [Pyrrhoderma noxium]|uniref:Uncharacterized protein n=1 Tax=Pyrrhoderma noxium TaxID=2282107 RepID=A0A286U6T6_9AGAM|nr:hypothetical protein PNOK_0901000 [Pyrrhoderma noxium]